MQTDDKAIGPILPTKNQQRKGEREGEEAAQTWQILLLSVRK